MDVSSQRRDVKKLGHVNPSSAVSLPFEFFLSLVMVEILAGDAAAVRVNEYVAQQSCLLDHGQCSIVNYLFLLLIFCHLLS